MSHYAVIIPPFYRPIYRLEALPLEEDPSCFFNQVEVAEAIRGQHSLFDPLGSRPHPRLARGYNGGL